VVRTGEEEKPRRVYIPSPRKIRPPVIISEPEVPKEIYALKARKQFMENIANEPTD